MASLDVGNYIKDVQIMDLVSANQVLMVWDLELRSSSDTFTAATLDSTDSVASLTAGTTAAAGQPINGQTVVQVTGGSAGTRALVVTALRKGAVNNNSGLPVPVAGDLGTPVLARSYPWDVVGLIWGAVTDDAGNSPTGYKVYRGTGSGGPYTEIASTASVTYTDATAVADTTYYYVVTAYDVGRETPNSNEQSAAAIANVAEKSMLFETTVGNDGRLTTSNDNGHDWRRDWTVPKATTKLISVSMWAQRDHEPAADFVNFWSIGRGPGVTTEDGVVLTVPLGLFAPHFLLYEAGGTNTKSWGIAEANAPALGEWFMFTATWDGTNNADCIKVYLNGEAEASVQKTSDDDVTAIDAPMGGGVADAPAAIGTTASNHHRAESLIFSVATWDVVLTAAEIAAMYNSGSGTNFDLTADSGDYTSSADLQDLWLPGKGATNNSALPYTFGPGFNYAGAGRDGFDEGNLENEEPDPSTPNQRTDIPDGT